MTDVLNEEQRKYCMSQIRGGNTTPEVLLRKALWRKGLRYRLRSSLPGRPDITFPKEKIAIFVDGCFWHKCPEHFQMPKTRTYFWAQKIEKNIKRDMAVNEELENMGWTVIRFWEHEINSNTPECVNIVLHIIKPE
ncbi:very short patch repair endonuclease [Aeromonas hydrophila]|uniref:very short patch repair endonuclease n=1 Tax=Aeromonas hydrophila TaxID=644 RepID=UPI00227CF9B8|nr:very short patch repair endonuclease [Aeromonas hydrophila]WAF91663.1 very short patch repair endonuclease [Aeromonas hydrophila]WAG04389.1 very short patch repair endonuclease [Aeromonas hydrophila]